VDVDRDVNLPVEGRIAAGSLDRGSGTAPRFSSSEKGLGILLDLFDEVGIRAVLFVEGRTAQKIDLGSVSRHQIGFHGMDHEDLTGKSTGVEFDDFALEDVLRQGYDSVRDKAGKVECFRAPYMSADDRILSHVSSLGVGYDSSFYAAPGDCAPHMHPSGIKEFPVPEGRDETGKKMAAYLWPMHEGRRGPSDYIWQAGTVDGPYVLATHSWHMVESRSDGPMDPARIGENVSDVRSVIEGLLDSGYRCSVFHRSHGLRCDSRRSHVLARRRFGDVDESVDVVGIGLGEFAYLFEEVIAGEAQAVELVRPSDLVLLPDPVLNHARLGERRDRP